jgi:hypothetical protein
MKVSVLALHPHVHSELAYPVQVKAKASEAGGRDNDMV